MHLIGHKPTFLILFNQLLLPVYLYHTIQIHGKYQFLSVCELFWWLFQTIVKFHCSLFLLTNKLSDHFLNWQSMTME